MFGEGNHGGADCWPGDIDGGLSHTAGCLAKGDEENGSVSVQIEGEIANRERSFRYAQRLRDQLVGLYCGQGLLVDRLDILGARGGGEFNHCGLTRFRSGRVYKRGGFQGSRHRVLSCAQDRFYRCLDGRGDGLAQRLAGLSLRNGDQAARQG